MKRNPKAGRGPCPVCGERVFYRRTASGKLTVSCDACDFSGFAEAGGLADRRLSTALQPIEGTEPPAPEPQTKPAPRPAQKPAAPVKRAPATPFGLGQL